MRKYTCLLLFAFLLNGCDDGDITVSQIDFEDVEKAQNCTDENLLVYKLKPQESLLLQVAENTFPNEPTAPNDPEIYTINNSTYRLAYRSYDGTIQGTDICSLIQPVSPKVINEWYATDGIMYITTAADKENTADNGTTITGYTHTITIKNVTYVSGGLPVTVPEIKFGDFKTAIATEDKLTLTFKEAANQCGGLTGQIYNFNENSAITIDAIDPSLIVNSVTPLNEPRTGLLDTAKNKLLYRVYTGGVITNSFFCNATTPTTPVLKETWTGDNGLPNVSGIIEVTTSTLGTSFKHVIVLKQAIIRKGNNFISLGDNFVLGELVTTP